MYPLQSMTHATVYIVISIYFLLLVTLRTNPFNAAGAFVQEIFTRRKYLLHFVAVMAILFFNKIELWVESHMKYTADFTPKVYALEGNFVAAFQQFFQNDILTMVTSMFYVVIFPCLMIASILIYTYQKKHRLFYALCYTVMINYIVAIPFYLFFPVLEVWAFHPKVDLLITQAFPAFESEYRPLSGLDNCFPSLHTSISVSMAILAAHSGNRFWKWFSILSCSIIIFAIFYLGIHWVTDMFGGVILGTFAARVGIRISEERTVLGGLLVQPRRLKQQKVGD
ncbi:phosphatase PAP2 family protein [Paenibacillus lutrae]|uniref:Phosphatase PAP2 family protein n=1 Tax=Paenibacillus lutrae TaxID=2078573 RepID=A0A7X3JZ46_9BACL|nr:phosphatase PAP2 family protein [Paenibacillus lutrae]MVO99649.1 phosphatase PAP2 family protein [Paenibacillus lutrae]